MGHDNRRIQQSSRNKIYLDGHDDWRMKDAISDLYHDQTLVTAIQMYPPFLLLVGVDVFRLYGHTLRRYLEVGGCARTSRVISYPSKSHP